MCYVFFFQAEDGIRDLVRSRGLGDVYKRQALPCASSGIFLAHECSIVQTNFPDVPAALAPA